MRLTVIGTGRLIDVDQCEPDTLTAGRSPFYEPALNEMLSRHVRRGSLGFSASLSAAAFGDADFPCVPTSPVHGDRPRNLATDLAIDVAADLEALISQFVPHVERPTLVIGRSLMFRAEFARIATRIGQLAPVGSQAELAWNPFVTPQPSISPPRRTPGRRAGRRHRRNRTRPSHRSAVPRLWSRFSAAGACPKACGPSPPLPPSMAPRASHVCCTRSMKSTIQSADEPSNWPGSSLADRLPTPPPPPPPSSAAPASPIADDVRDLPALAVAVALHQADATVTVHYPQANDNARRAALQLRRVDEHDQACRSADLVVHLTDWPQYRQLGPQRLRSVVRRPALLDARNTLNLSKWHEAGQVVHGLGRAQP